jgi:hypothetical protein
MWFPQMYLSAAFEAGIRVVIRMHCRQQHRYWELEIEIGRCRSFLGGAGGKHDSLTCEFGICSCTQSNFTALTK